jgi:hypothetical protein
MSTRFEAGVIGNREMSNTPGREVTEDKLWHLTRYTERFGLALTAAPSDMTVALFQADRDGKLGDDVNASCNVDGSSGNTTFDVLKNGVSILTGVITVGQPGDRVQVAGTWASDAARTYTVGDVISCTINESSHTGAQGPMLAYSRIEQGD